MPSIIDDINKPAKIMLVGKSGAGKTGSLASLVVAGYNLRIIDTDKGVRSLRSLLTDPHYPYATLIAKKGIDLNKAVRYIPIDTAMKLRSISRVIGMGDSRKTVMETILAPVDAKAWMKVNDLLCHWKEPDGTDFGPVASWGRDDVLVFDSFSTLAKCVYYFSQALNNRLGARDSGRDYQRDVGEAQSQLTRLLELLYDSSINCNVIIITHITWVDESGGVASRPQEQQQGDNILPPQPDGYPSAIGRALSPQMGKYFNDVYIVKSSGSGSSVTRRISTVPQDGVVAKNSVYLERDYPIASGLAEIFAAIRGTDKPTELLEATASQRRGLPASVAQRSPPPVAATSSAV